MKNKVRLLILAVICLASLSLTNDSHKTLAGSKLRPDRQLLVESLRGNTDAVKNLLKNGVDPNTPPGPDDKGMTALMFAAWKGHSEIVKILVLAGADVDAVSQTGATPLMYATYGGYEDCVRTLLSKGARTDIRLRGEGPTALSYSLKTNNPAIVSLIAKSSSPETINLKNKKGDTVLLSAAKSNNSGIIDALLEAGNISLEEKDGLGQTALMYAARNGNTLAVIHLLKKGANPNTKDNNGVTALAKAKVGNHRAVEQVLRAADGSK
jgi:ankyrin repeat protein